MCRLLQLAGQAPEGGGDGASMDGFLATMMQQFLSKDILYPSLKASLRSAVHHPTVAFHWVLRPAVVCTT